MSADNNSRKFSSNKYSNFEKSKIGKDSHPEFGFADYSETEAQFNEKITKLDERITEIVESTEKKMSDIQKSERTELKNVRREIEESKSRVVETLALFAVLFTFLSAQVQIFRDSSKDKVVPLMFISSGLLIFFVFLLDIMVSNNAEKASRFTKIKYLVLFLAAIALLAVGYKTYPN